MATWTELPTEKTLVVPGQWRLTESKADDIFARRHPHLDAGERATRIYIAGILATLEEAGRHERRRAEDFSGVTETTVEIFDK